MNYQKIYNDFIENRKIKKVKGYSEKHHILPRCLGGTDEKQNLIILFASDHLFAHLLLARVYGWSMWFGLKAMLEMASWSNKDRISTNKSKRFHFEIARKRVAEYYSKNYSGENSPSADIKKYFLYKHIKEAGYIAYGTRFKLAAQTGLSTKQIGQLINGYNFSSNGWFNKDVNPLGLTEKNDAYRYKNRNVKYTVYNENGYKIILNRYELGLMIGKSNACDLLRGAVIWSQGFTLRFTNESEEVRRIRKINEYHKNNK